MQEEVQKVLDSQSTIISTVTCKISEQSTHFNQSIGYISKVKSKVVKTVKNAAFDFFHFEVGSSI